MSPASSDLDEDAKTGAVSERLPLVSSSNYLVQALKCTPEGAGAVLTAFGQSVAAASIKVARARTFGDCETL